ncbi:MAG: hypothetical protein PVF65_11035 [Sphingomonadales bacterium]|jgi:hypothetical protein
MMRLLALACVLILSACDETPFELPAPTTNNAVAFAEGPDGPTLYSFMGLGEGKTHEDIKTDAYACAIKLRSCKTLPPLPFTHGRLASIAVTVDDKIYIFGGYTVGTDHSEVSTPNVLMFDPETETYSARAPIPKPVDDSVALVYDNRFIYLVSGWHNSDNVNLTQVYDIEKDKWFQATPYPGTPVFGHAGGLVHGQIIIADGVAVIGYEEETGRRIYGLINDVWHGVIDPEHPEHIKWRKWAAHPGRPTYRAAAYSDEELSQVIFAGGSDNPYNYDGIGYNGNPAPALSQIIAFDARTGEWLQYKDKPLATMDHRGLLKAMDHYWTLGGMENDQLVTTAISSFKLEH